MNETESPREQLLSRLDDNIAALPAWARPPFIGLLTVYMMIAIKAIYLLPITIGVLIFSGPEGVLKALWILIMAGVAGFLGGVAFTIVAPLARRIGHIGPYLLWSSAFGAYITTAVLLVDGYKEGGAPHLAHLAPMNWWILGVGSVTFGSVFARAISTENPRKSKRWIQRVQRVTSRVHPPVR
jgi:hypothetical protein